MLFSGVATLGLGFAHMFDSLGSATLSFMSDAIWSVPGWLSALVLVLMGLALSALAIYQLNRSLLAAFVPPGSASVVDTVYRHRHRQRGPKVVAVGGGTGLSILLSGLKAYTDHITAVVTVADDGGSSGKLRRELGVLPPGDFRNCIAALADDEALTTQLFQYRFPNTRGKAGNGHSLEGHSFGNLFITAMASVTGSFEKALVESGRVLAIKGQILPSTLENVTLCADLVDESAIRRVAGESAIPEARLPIERVYLEPTNVPAYPPVLRAILDAELIVIGPGSLFTSVLPNLLVDDISRAIRASSALKVYVCNVATQPGETDGFTVGDHVRAIERHVGSGLFSYVLANNNQDHPLPADWGLEIVDLDTPDQVDYQVLAADVVDEARPWRHDAGKLAQLLIRMIEQREEKDEGVQIRLDEEVRQ
ncbi:MAG: YvcK family protein [Anaerolineae bacterium]